MTPTGEQLCYTDAYCQTVDARVSTVDAGNDGAAVVVLDRTVFYPGGGGQPAPRRARPGSPPWPALPPRGGGGPGRGPAAGHAEGRGGGGGGPGRPEEQRVSPPGGGRRGRPPRHSPVTPSVSTSTGRDDSP